MQAGSIGAAAIKTVAFVALAGVVLIVGVATLVVVAALAALAVVPALLLVAGMRRPIAPLAAVTVGPIRRPRRAG